MDISKQAAEMRQRFAEERRTQSSKKVSRPTSGLAAELFAKASDDRSLQEQEVDFNQSSMLRVQNE